MEHNQCRASNLRVCNARLKAQANACSHSHETMPFLKISVEAFYMTALHDSPPQILNFYLLPSKHSWILDHLIHLIVTARRRGAFRNHWVTLSLRYCPCDKSRNPPRFARPFDGKRPAHESNPKHSLRRKTLLSHHRASRVET